MIKLRTNSCVEILEPSDWVAMTMGDLKETSWDGKDTEDKQTCMDNALINFLIIMCIYIM